MFQVSRFRVVTLSLDGELAKEEVGEEAKRRQGEGAKPRKQ